MKNTKRSVTNKIIVGYILAGILAATALWIIYNQINNYTALTEIKNENNEKLFLVGKAITGLYEAESLTRNIIQTSDSEKYSSYKAKVDTILSTINKVMDIADDTLQIKKIDSIKILIDNKNENFEELITIYQQKKDRGLQQNILAELKKKSQDYGNYQNYDDRFKNLSDGGKRYLKILLEWSKEDNQERLSNETLDSVAKRFYQAVAEIEQKERKYEKQIEARENKLLKNDQTLTKQLREILSSIEDNERKKYYSRLEASNEILNKTSTIILIVGGISFMIAIIFLYLITRDVSKSQKYRNELEKEKSYTESLLKTRESLINTVTHDLRSPLNTVIGYTDLLERTSLDTKQKHYLGHLKKSSDYILHLVNDLLDLSKLEAGKMKVEELPFSPKKLIENTIDSVIPINDQKNLDVKLFLDKKLNQQFLSDPFRIKQVLTNLINNAYKFTETGSISIRASLIENRLKDNTLTISVSDTGIGITEQQQRHIFDEFSQGDSNTEKRYGGFGLGLSITKKIITLLDGSVSLESKAGEGSTFTLTIPVKNHSFSEPNESERSSYTYLQSLEQIQILIVDDDPSQLALTSEVISLAGISYNTACNGLDALNALNKKSYDLVLTDIQMPKMNGFELIEKVNKDYEIPFIALSGKTNATSEFYKQAGFFSSLRKPYTPKELLDLVSEALRITINSPVSIDQKANELIVEDYSLEDLKIFAQGDSDSLYAILDTFYESTKENLKSLKTHIKEKDIDSIQRIAHKMLPMFKQIKAKYIIPILTKLEHPEQFDLNKETIIKLAKEGIHKIESLMQELKVKR